MIHGITGSRDEGGLYTLLAAKLARRGVSSLRFDLRAHGRSGGKQEQMTIAGETADVRASVGWLRSQGFVSAGFVAASFGAVSACEYLARGEPDARCLVLLNPVLDLRLTFLEPMCEWARASFNSLGFEHLERHGFLLLDGRFRIGRGLVEEMKRTHPGKRLRDLTIPVLTIHGDADSCVPYTVSRELGMPNPGSSFLTVLGADHGFGRSKERHQVLRATINWLRLNLSHSAPTPVAGGLRARPD